MANRSVSETNRIQSYPAENSSGQYAKGRESFLSEARMLARFSEEPGIVSVKDYFEENNTGYIIMEYREGISLKQYVDKTGRMSYKTVTEMLRPVIRSLKKMHDERFMHRDISPDNIMIVGNSMKLIDFGAAREFADEKSMSIIIKHGYAPMEQYSRRGEQWPWTDVYALCATIYHCITCKIPPDANDRVFYDIELELPSELGIETDPQFEKILMKGMEIRPENRLRDVDELLAYIDKDTLSDRAEIEAEIITSEQERAESESKSKQEVYTEKKETPEPVEPNDYSTICLDNEETALYKAMLGEIMIIAQITHKHLKTHPFCGIMQCKRTILSIKT